MERVLIVDDVVEQLIAYQRLLRRHFDIVTANDGMEALELLKRDTHIQVIVSDMSMPCMNGIELFVHAAKMKPDVTRIMLTGNTDLNSTIEAINRGCVFRYLKKPCSRDDLVEAIEAGLRLHHSNSIGVITPDTPIDPDDQNHPAILADSLRSTLLDNGIHPHFQPIVDLKSNRILGAEALARWEHPIDGWISPAMFIPLAEQLGLMPELGRMMLTQACQEAQNWHHMGFEGSVSVNVSAVQFIEGCVKSDVCHALEKSNLHPQKLILELTESVLIHDPRSIIQTLNELRSLGIKLAIDDFGTGYSSLAYLKHLPIDRLKIDRCFIQEIDRDERDLAFVHTILDLAQKLDLVVVAEGVERLEQHDTLLDLGCDLGQGYFFARALHPDSFLVHRRKQTDQVCL